MPGLRSGDRERDRLEVAHFAHHDDIGIFAERAAQRRAERSRVRVHFALGDVATLRLEDIFDRIFERDDVFATFDIYLLDERRQRGRFAAADRTGDENEAVLITREQFEMFRVSRARPSSARCVLMMRKTMIDAQVVAGRHWCENARTRVA